MESNSNGISFVVVAGKVIKAFQIQAIFSAFFGIYFSSYDLDKKKQYTQCNLIPISNRFNRISNQRNSNLFSACSFKILGLFMFIIRIFRPFGIIFYCCGIFHLNVLSSFVFFLNKPKILSALIRHIVNNFPFKTQFRYNFDDFSPFQTHVYL